MLALIYERRKSVLLHDIRLAHGEIALARGIAGTAEHCDAVFAIEIIRAVGRGIDNGKRIFPV